jgi:hypothetical protein
VTDGKQKSQPDLVAGTVVWDPLRAAVDFLTNEMPTEIVRDMNNIPLHLNKHIVEIGIALLVYCRSVVIG